MSVHQYIGARYVPKFYENGGSSDWVSGVAYEPLTIVTRNGNSYTSKTTVPANIGAPEANPTYWAPTGIFNSQLSQIQNDLYDLRSQIGQGYQRIVLLSDSYGVDNVCGGSSWITQTIAELGTRVVDRYEWGGAGFGWGVNSPYYFPALFNTVTADSEADCVMLLAGANDGNLLNSEQATEADILSGLVAGISVLKTKYPKAKIIIGFVGRHKNVNSFRGYYLARNVYKKCIEYGARYLDNAEFTLHNRAFIDTGDIHPSLAGSTRLAIMAIIVLTGGAYDVNEDFVYNANLTVSVRNSRTYYRYYATAAETHISFEQTVTPMGAPYEVTNFGDLNNLFSPVEEVNYHEGASLVMDSGYAGKTAQIAFSGSFPNGKLSAQFMSIDGACTGSFSLIRIILPKRVTFDADTMLC